MNVSHSQFSPRLVLAALALSLSLAAGAQTPPPVPADRPAAGAPARQMAYGMKGMAALHAELKLDARQEALWQDAAKTSRESMRGTRERMRTERAETLALLKQPGADLRAVVKRMDEAREQAQKQHAIALEPWLSVYDALNPEQKEKARVFVQSRFERGGRAGPRGHGHHGRG